MTQHFFCFTRCIIINEVLTFGPKYRTSANPRPTIAVMIVRTLLELLCVCAQKVIEKKLAYLTNARISMSVLQIQVRNSVPCNWFFIE